MHGRLKVKTTAQQEAERKAHREEKLKTYQKAMSAIFANREALKNASSSDEISEEDKIKIQQALMKMTAGVLMANPDISTLWNIRKEVLGIGLTILDSNPMEHDLVLKKELELTFQCLQNNPKSYGAWYHRCWSMLKMKSPKWDQELRLCNDYLKLDGRNFHCWDHRRFVTHHAGISVEEELNYSKEDLIDVNFSNYSAWHYRSKLLPMAEGCGSNGKISETQRMGELESVQSAAFTDPNDSSAWFYLQWLLGRSDDVLKPIKAKYDGDKLMVAFSRTLASTDIQISMGDSIREDITWRNVKGLRNDSLWIAENISKDTPIRISVKGNNEDVLEVPQAGCFVLTKPRLCDTDFSTFQILEKQLEDCEQLLEFETDPSLNPEPGNSVKWITYTKILIMLKMDAQKYHKDIIKGFEDLCQIDPSRKGYYKDQRSKIIIDHVFAANPNSDEIDLSSQGLTSVAYFDQLFAFVHKLDISKNDLTSVKSLMPYLVNCKELHSDLNRDNIVAEITDARHMENMKIIK